MIEKIIIKSLENRYVKEIYLSAPPTFHELANFKQKRLALGVIQYSH